MIRTGEQYIESIRDGGEVYVNAERVRDVPNHPMFNSLVDIRARIYDMAHEESGEKFAIGLKLPHSQQEWWMIRRATDAVFEEVGEVITRVGDETVGEMCSMFDGQDVLNTIGQWFTANPSGASGGRKTA